MIERDSLGLSQSETRAQMKPLRIVSHKLSSFSEHPLLPTQQQLQQQQHQHQQQQQQKQQQQQQRRHASSALTKKKQEYQFHETNSKISLHNSHVLEGLTYHPQQQQQQQQLLQQQQQRQQRLKQMHKSYPQPQTPQHLR